MTETTTEVAITPPPLPPPSPPPPPCADYKALSLHELRFAYHRIFGFKPTGWQPQHMIARLTDHYQRTGATVALNANGKVIR